MHATAPPERVAALGFLPNDRNSEAARRRGGQLPRLAAVALLEQRKGVTPDGLQISFSPRGASNRRQVRTEPRPLRSPYFTGGGFCWCALPSDTHAFANSLFWTRVYGSLSGRMSDHEQLTATECAVLGLLSFGEASGYDLMKLAERSVGLIWRPVKSQLYTLLPQFVERGFAERRDVPQQGRPDKVMYRVTGVGREMLRTSLMELKPEGRAGHAVFNFKVFFGDIVGAEHVREAIAARRGQIAERRKLLEAVRDGADSEDDFFPLLTLELGMDEQQAFLRWASRVLARLDDRTAAELHAGQGKG